MTWFVLIKAMWLHTDGTSGFRFPVARMFIFATAWKSSQGNPPRGVLPDLYSWTIERTESEYDHSYPSISETGVPWFYLNSHQTFPCHCTLFQCQPLFWTLPWREGSGGGECAYYRLQFAVTFQNFPSAKLPIKTTAGFCLNSSETKLILNFIKQFYVITNFMEQRPL
jgi:hypothetical protein